MWRWKRQTICSEETILSFLGMLLFVVVIMFAKNIWIAPKVYSISHATQNSPVNIDPRASNAPPAARWLSLIDVGRGFCIAWLGWMNSQSPFASNNIKQKQLAEIQVAFLAVLPGFEIARVTTRVPRALH